MRIFLTRDNPQNLANSPLGDILGASFRGILALLFALAWTYVTLSNLGVVFDLGAQLALQLGLVLVYSLLLFRPKLWAVFIPLLAVTGLLSLFLHTPLFLGIHNFLSQLGAELASAFLWSFKATQEGVTMPESYATLVGILALTLAYLFTALKPKPFALALVMAIPFFGGPESDQIKGNYILAIGICLFVIGMTFNQGGQIEKKVRLNTWPLILVCLILVFSFVCQSLVPDNFFQIPALADYIRQARKRLNTPEIVSYYEFTLRDAGYYPVNDNLGGPMDLDHQLFMQVTGPSSAFRLRGSVANDYNGRMWLGSEMEPNYIFDNQSRHGVQASIFAYPSPNSPAEAYVNQIFSLTDVEIRPVRQPIQIVFNGGKPLSINSGQEDEAYYYNRSGQIYAGHELSLPYTVQGYVQKELKRKTLWSYLERALDSKTVSLQLSSPTDSYKSMVERHDSELAKIIYQNPTQDPVKVLEKLRLISQHLETKYQYSLQVAYPDPNLDFLEQFLKDKEGYCTYFATALTLFARELGMEARYVEGFVVPPVDEGLYPAGSSAFTRDVLTDHAHAWSEIYVEGLGWLGIDAIPASALDALTGQGEAEEDETDSSEPTEPSQSDETETTPTTTAPPPTEPQPKPSQQMTTPPASPGEQVPPPKPPKQMGRVTKVILAVLAVLLSLILALAIWLRTAKKRLARRHDQEYLLYSLKSRSQADLLRQIWSDMQVMAELAGCSFTPNLTLTQRFAVLEQRFISQGAVAGYPACLALEKCFFAEEELSQQELQAVFAYYALLEDQLKDFLPKRSWYWQRLLFPGQTAKF
ncbi:MAG: transglutaminase domain-containing protein [Eubacteriales bacterium]|nr:transglutaminase domain-containing protein [Eubacteriales bacterium]